MEASKELLTALEAKLCIADKPEMIYILALIKGKLKNIKIKNQTIDYELIRIDGIYYFDQHSFMPIPIDSHVQSHKVGMISISVINVSNNPLIRIHQVSDLHKPFLLEKLTTDNWYFCAGDTLMAEYRTQIEHHVGESKKVFEGTGYYKYSEKHNDLVKYAERDYEYTMKDGNAVLLKDTYTQLDPEKVRTRNDR